MCKSLSYKPKSQSFLAPLGVNHNPSFEFLSPSTVPGPEASQTFHYVLAEVACSLSHVAEDTWLLTLARPYLTFVFLDKSPTSLCFFPYQAYCLHKFRDLKDLPCLFMVLVKDQNEQKSKKGVRTLKLEGNTPDSC